MTVLERIFSDLRRGENIDLYVTLAAALVLVPLNVFGLVPGESIAALILALLGLVSVSLLGNRHRLDEVRNRLAAISVSGTTLVDEFPSDFRARMEEARDIWLIGTHHSAALTAYYQVFQNLVKEGGRLRFLLIAPDGAAARMAAMRFPGNVEPDQESLRIKSSLKTISALRQTAPDYVEVRIIDFLVDYTAFVLDPSSPRAVIYLERSTYKTSGGSRKPKFVYKKGDIAWFGHISAEVDQLWDSARVYAPSPNK
jgi:hypothetical protein